MFVVVYVCFIPMHGGTLACHILDVSLWRLSLFYCHLFLRVHINRSAEHCFSHHESFCNVPVMELQPFRYANQEHYSDGDAFDCRYRSEQRAFLVIAGGNTKPWSSGTIWLYEGYESRLIYSMSDCFFCVYALEASKLLQCFYLFRPWVAVKVFIYFVVRGIESCTNVFIFQLRPCNDMIFSTLGLILLSTLSAFEASSSLLSLELVFL